MGGGLVSYRNNVVNLTKVRNVVICKNKPFLPVNWRRFVLL